MINFDNYSFDLDKVKQEDYFVCTVGYEERSRYILNRMQNKVCKNNIFVLYFADLMKMPEISACINALEEDSIQTQVATYENGETAVKEIVDFIRENTHKGGRVFIDYSSMPRTWYSKLPVALSELGTENVFLYAVGSYPGDYKAYPSAGTDSRSVIGCSSLRVKKRLHILGVGYDAIRTEALISILDPDMYTVCCAHYSEDLEMEQRVCEVNKHIIEQALSFVSLCTDDFKHMVARLCEIAYEYLPLGDVVLVPDGPKPLIMAMSLVPQLLGKEGVVCMHVSRNPKCREFVNVSATGTIIGFNSYDDGKGLEHSNESALECE